VETELATKSIPNKKDFDELVRRLDTAIDKASKKPVYVVEKHGNYYDVVHYVTRTKLFTGLPSRKAAEKACSRFNKNPTHRYHYHTWRRIRDLCEDIAEKQFNLNVHKHSLENAKAEKYMIILDKMSEDHAKLLYLEKELTLLV